MKRRTPSLRIHGLEKAWSSYWHAPLAAFLSVTLLIACAPESSTTQSAISPGVAEKVLERGPVTVRVQVDPSPARLSDEPTLTVTIEAEQGVRVEKPPFGDGIGDFLIRDFREPLTQTRDNLEISRQIYRLEPTRTGKLAIDSIPIVFHDQRPQGDGKTYRVETEPMEVVIESVVASELASLDDLEGMSEPVTLDSPGLGFIWWAAIAIGLVALLTGVILWRRRNSKPQHVPTAYELAIAELEELREKDMAREDIKRFYVELTGIVRRYIERTTEVQAAEQTTEEFLREISSGEQFENEQRERLRGFLESADLVKFAAHRPAPDDVERAMSRAGDFIRQPAESVAAAGEPQTEDAVP